MAYSFKDIEGNTHRFELDDCFEFETDIDIETDEITSYYITVNEYTWQVKESTYNAVKDRVNKK